MVCTRRICSLLALFSFTILGGLADDSWVEKNKDYLKANKKKSGVTTLASGLQYEVLKSGTSLGDGINEDPHPDVSSVCSVHYRGKLIDGKEFDSSYKRGKPANFKPSQVIRGWTEALQLMTPGDKWLLTVPPEIGYGYGNNGPGPGGSVLIFELELLGISPPSTLPIIGPIMDSFDMSNPQSMLMVVFIIYFIFSRLSFGGGATKDKNSVALSEHAGKASNPKVFFMVQIGAETKPQRIEFELFSEIVPKTAENFRCLCTGEKGASKLSDVNLSYKNSGFHRIIPRFMCQGGDFTNHNGSGGESIYGRKFEDEWENGYIQHEKPMLLSMANAGPNTNGSQFFITTVKCNWLDAKHVVFGQVTSGQSVVSAMEAKGSSAGRPVVPVKIVDCGEIKSKST